MKLSRKQALIYGLYCIIIAVFVVVIVLIFQPHKTNTGTSTHPTTKTQQAAGSETARAGNAQITNKGAAAAKDGSQTTPKTLNNTGPGNVIGLFAAASLIGAWFWRRRLLHGRL